MGRVVALLLVLACGDVRAEGPWTMAVGAGPAGHRIGTVFSDHFTPGVTARVDAGYRVMNNLAIGPHLGAAYVHTAQYGRYQAAPMTVVPLEVGVGAQLVVGDRVLIAPWAGWLDTAALRFKAAGISVGFDLVVRGDDRLTAVVSITSARENFRAYPETFDSISGGIAYRYW